MIRRRLAAIGVGLCAAGLVLASTLGDALVAAGRPELAAGFPVSRTLAAERVFSYAPEAMPAPARQVLAKDVLARTPMSAPALTELSDAAAARGDTARALRLLALAGELGWHDERTQRRLYNAALERLDAAAALRHADSLLRRRKARDELFAQFDRGVAIPVFRDALAATMRGNAAWPRDYLVHHGGVIDDAALLALASAYAAPRGGLDRDVAGPLVARLINARRAGAARAVAALVPGVTGLAPGPLGWSDAAAYLHPLPFDWRLGEGYRTGAGGAAGEMPVLDIADPYVRRPATRLLALPPGRYVLKAASGPLAGWRWAIGCGTADPAPVDPLARVQNFTVGADCPVQRLAVTADLDSGAQGLGGLSVGLQR